MGLRKAPYAFTEHGVYMAGNVLRSKRAIEVSVFVVRAFVQLRDLLATHKTLARQLSALKQRVGKHHKDIAGLIATIHQLLEPPPAPKRGKFHPNATYHHNGNDGDADYARTQSQISMSIAELLRVKRRYHVPASFLERHEDLKKSENIAIRIG